MGIPLLLETIENVRRRANPKLKVIGILPMMFNAHARHDSEALEELRASVESAKIEVFHPVSRSTVFDKANVEGRAVLELFPTTPGVEQYRLVAQHILNHAA